MRTQGLYCHWVETVRRVRRVEVHNGDRKSEGPYPVLIQEPRRFKILFTKFEKKRRIVTEEKQGTTTLRPTPLSSRESFLTKC